MSTGKATDCDVIVIGAGAAGLAAMQALGESGLSALCIEAGNRIGGRAHTDTETFGIPFDRGAHWLHNAQINPFIDIGKALGFDLYPSPENGFTAGDDPSGKAMWEEARAIEELMEREGAAGRDVALSELYAPHTEWSVTALLMQVLPMGRDLHEISTKDHYDYEEGPNWFCREGYGALLAATARDVPVSVGIRAEAVTASSGGVEVRTSDGTLTARAVIVTVSQGVLQAGDIAFDPPLENERLSAIDAINLGTYNHAVLHFPEGTLPVEPDTWVTYPIDTIENGTIRGGGALCNISGTGLCSFETAGAFARELEAAGEAAALDFALSRLADVFGSELRTACMGGHATAWGKDPLFKGSYSAAHPGRAHERPHLRKPHAERVFFAGEATNLVEPGTVSGAHKEGRRGAGEAAALLA